MEFGITKYKEKHGMDWPVGVAYDSYDDALALSGFETYVLLF